MIHRQLHKAERAGIAKRRCIGGGMGLGRLRKHVSPEGACLLGCVLEKWALGTRAQFIFRVLSGSGVACGAVDYISMLLVHKIRLICPTTGKGTEKLSEQDCKATDRDETKRMKSL
jgi:hypothetical protein